MTPPPRPLRFWLWALAGALFLVWLFSPILLPFLLGLILAYFLNPAANRLTAWGLPRSLAAGLIVGAGLSLLVALFVLVVPVLVEQAVGLAAEMPVYLKSLAAWLKPHVLKVMASLDPSALAKLEAQWADLARKAAAWLGQVLGGLLSGGLALVNLAALLALTPLATFYLLRDWPGLMETVKGWVPRRQEDTVRELVRRVDAVLFGYVGGTAAVCLILGLFYAVGLTLMGLKFGLAIGLVSGIISFIPYLGTALGFGASLGVALYQFWPEWTMPLVALAIFLAGQMLADYVLTPKFVGDKVGLHPLWVIFGLFAGGSLFGFVGMLVAVPVSGVVGVLARFAVERYRASSYFLGREATPPEA
ncbi:MAG: AI-2E family transporter [Deltaproteobacteria bacterium]|nr:AI-2E family transporter [Deltaproteobacteria bacterium]